MTNSNDDYTVAISVVTGTQGQEIVRRFQEINAISKTSTNILHVRGSTRNVSSQKSVELANMPNVSVVAVDYKSPESLADAVKGVDAVFVNHVLWKEEFRINKNIVDAAVGENVKHILYSSTISCDKEAHQVVPH